MHPRDALLAANIEPICSPCGRRRRGPYGQRRGQVRKLSAAGFRIYLESDRWPANRAHRHNVRAGRQDWPTKILRDTLWLVMHVGQPFHNMPNKAVAEPAVRNSHEDRNIVNDLGEWCPIWAVRGVLREADGDASFAEL
jgi:hypothetical protein